MNITADAAPDVEVHLEAVEGVLIGRIEIGAPMPNRQYAFYLEHNGHRVETRRYSNDKIAEFATQPGEGRYRAIGFVRDGKEGAAVMVPSKPIDGSGSAFKIAILKAPVALVGLDSIKAALENPGPTRLDVRAGSYTYQCFASPPKGDSLFVMLGGSVPERHLITLPRFNRFSWAIDFPGTQLCVADPTLTLDDEIQLAWYFGSDREDAMTGLVDVVLGVASALGVRRDRIFAYGSSGGGFAALQLVARLGQGATAIAINAQTDVLRYSSTASVGKFLSVCTRGLRGEDAQLKYGDRLSALDSWSTDTADSSRCLLVQNKQDHHHYEEHFLPFLRHFGVAEDGGGDSRIAAMIYDCPNGHGAEPRSMLPSILEKASQLRTHTKVAASTSRELVTMEKAAASGLSRIRGVLHLWMQCQNPTTLLLEKTCTDMSVTKKIASIKPKSDFLNHTYISLRNAYVYFAVGKAANSTVKHHLYELEYAGSPFKTKSVHDRQSAPLLSPFQLPDDLLEEVFSSPKYFRFSVVRNPYARILSCYLDRIVPANTAPYRQLMIAMGRTAGEQVSFGDFVRTICQQKPFDQNNHWRLQVNEICTSATKCDFIGKQETFAQDMAQIWSRVGRGRSMPDFAKENLSPSITSAEKRLDEFYTPELADLVRDAYREDFKEFGYSLDLK